MNKRVHSLKNPQTSSISVMGRIDQREPGWTENWGGYEESFPAVAIAVDWWDAKLALMPLHEFEDNRSWPKGSKWAKT